MILENMTANSKNWMDASRDMTITAYVDTFLLVGEYTFIPTDLEEMAAILSDHPEILQRIKRLREEGSKGRPLREVMAELEIEV